MVDALDQALGEREFIGSGMYDTHDATNDTSVCSTTLRQRDLQAMIHHLQESPSPLSPRTYTCLTL